MTFLRCSMQIRTASNLPQTKNWLGSESGEPCWSRSAGDVLRAASLDWRDVGLRRTTGTLFVDTSRRWQGPPTDR